MVCGETISVAIGQGAVSPTPLLLARIDWRYRPWAAFSNNLTA